MADGEDKEGLLGAASDFGKEIQKAIMSNFDPKDIKDKILEVEKAATEVMNRFGQGREFVVAIKAGLADAAESVIALGGSFENVLQMQKDTSEALGRNVILTEKTYSGLYAATEVSGQSTKTLVSNFKDIGIGVGKVSENMEKVVNTARAIGVSAKDVSTQVVANLDLMNKFTFQGGVEGMAKMAAQAVNLRISIKDIETAMDRAFDPESAIEMAASLQRLGVAQSDLLDPLRLMDMAQNDPAELQNQIAEMSKRFVQLNKDGQFEIMPGAKREMQEIAKALGMNADTLAKMATSGAELEYKLSRIKFPEFATEEQQKMIANMAEMDPSGEYKIKFTDASGEAQEKSITELDETDIQAITKAQENASKSIEDVQREQLDVQKSMEAHLASLAGRTGRGIAATRTTEQLLSVPRTITQATTETIGRVGTARQVRETVGPAASQTLTTVEQLTSGKVTPEQALTELSKTIGGVEKTIKENFITAIDEAEKKLKEFAENTNPFLKIMANTGKFVGEKFKEVENLGPSGKTVKPVKDFYLKPLEQDELTLIGGTSLNKGTGGGNNTPSEITLNLKHEVKGDFPNNITAEQIANILKTDGDLPNAIATSMKDYLTGYGSSEVKPPLNQGLGYNVA